MQCFISYCSKHTKIDQIDDPYSFFRVIVSKLLLIEQKSDDFQLLSSVVVNYGHITVEQPWTASLNCYPKILMTISFHLNPNLAQAIPGEESYGQLKLPNQPKKVQIPYLAK